MARAASAAALATRACVSDDIWKATMPTSKAWAALAARAWTAKAPASSVRFKSLFMVVSPSDQNLKAAFFSTADDTATDAIMMKPRTMSCT
ncbi:hypothetical protein D3C85_1672710 [compost metagenome]